MTSPSSVTWLDDAGWKALHRAVRPEQHRLDEFRSLCLSGRLSVYRKTDLDKVADALKQQLRTHGRLQEADMLTRSRYSKPQLAEKVRSLLTQPASVLVAAVAAAPLPATVAPPATLRAGTAAPRHTATNDNTTQAAAGHSPQLAPQPSAPTPPRSLHLPLERGQSPPPSLHHHEATPTPPPPSLLLPHRLFESPLLPIAVVLKRTPFRHGMSRMLLDLTDEHAAELHARKAKLLLIPTEPSPPGGCLPATWPAAKDFAMSINGVPVTASWKRTWPARKGVPLVKTFLSLDATPYLTLAATSSSSRSVAPFSGGRRTGTQRFELDVHDRDYCASLLAVIAHPRSVDAVREDFLRQQTSLGVSRERSEAHLAALYARVAGAPVGSRGGDIGSSTASDRCTSAPRGCDDEDRVEAGDITIPTYCCVSRGRITTPVRGTRCNHLQCYDFDALVLTCHTNHYWNCPITGCDQPTAYRDLVYDSLVDAALKSSHGSGDESELLRLRRIPEGEPATTVATTTTGFGCSAIAWVAAVKGSSAKAAWERWHHQQAEKNVKKENGFGSPSSAGGMPGFDPSSRAVSGLPPSRKRHRRDVEVVAVEDSEVDTTSESSGATQFEEDAGLPLPTTNGTLMPSDSFDGGPRRDVEYPVVGGCWTPKPAEAPPHPPKSTTGQLAQWRAPFALLRTASGGSTGAPSHVPVRQCIVVD